PGAIVGFFMAQWISRALVAQLSVDAERMVLDPSFDWRVMAFTTVVAFLTAFVCGIVPALRAARVAPLDVLKVRTRALTASSGRRALASLSGGLVITQVTLSLALVIAAALFVRSFARLSNVPLGFDPDRVLVVNVDTGRVRTERADRGRLYQRIVEAAAGVPGVAQAGGSIWTPVDGGLRLGDPQSRITFNFVTPGWFAAYGTALRAGRDFTIQDTAEAPPVVIVNEAFVRTFMPGRSPIGEMVPHPRSRGRELQRTIVGVVADTIFETQRDGIQRIVYVPVAQSAATGPGELTEISVGVRPHAGPPMQLAGAVGAALRRVDPNLSFSFQLLTDHVQASVRQERLVAVLSGFFGALALTIAAMGLYAVTSYSVSRRVVEIGIRRALGAPALDVLGLVVGQSMILTAVGIALGLMAAAAGTRYLRAMLFGLTPLDPTTFVGVAVLFACVAVAASSIAALRAVSIDPMVAVRTE
ncbi:MAG: FtsX-like permease family protein, partial [Vicinamibacterales bacterium]